MRHPGKVLVCESVRRRSVGHKQQNAMAAAARRMFRVRVGFRSVLNGNASVCSLFCFLLDLCRFGLVSKRNAPAIVDKCVLGTEGMKANWRGNMANPGTKKEPATKPEPATAAAAAAGPTPTQEPKSSESAAINGGGPTAKPRRESIDGA